MKRVLTLAAAASVCALLAAIAGAAPGKLDPGFGTGGVVTTATAPGSGDDFQNGLVIQRNGRIVVGGESDMGTAAGGGNWRLVRYKSNGEPDPSFGTGGVVTTNMSTAGGEDEHIWALALQPDGKVVAAGDARTAAGGFDFVVARYMPDGSLDASFGAGGSVTTAIGPGTRRDTAFEVVIDSGGRILAGGFADMVAADGGRNFALARYNPNGALDTSFDGDGVVVTGVASGSGRDAINGIAIDADGKVVAGGHADMGPGAGGFNLALARYDTNGTLDTSFDADGILTTAIAPGDNFEFGLDVAIDAGGRIIWGGIADVGGAFVFDLALARIKPDGSLDSSFAGDGTVTTNVGPGDSDDDFESLVIQPTGRILVGGGAAPTAFGIDADFMVARYNPNGSLDGSFGAGGIVTTPTGASGADDEIFDIALQSDAKLVAAGECDQPSTGRDVCVVRYKAGEVD